MLPDIRPPDDQGGGLVNLVAELEGRLGGTPFAPPLSPDLAAAIPPADTYVLVLFDGLGDAQLAHPAAAPLQAGRRGVLQAPFPTTTTVSLATIATGLAPSTHGVIGHHMWLPALETVVNVLKWIRPGGSPLSADTSGLLPAPNLWERLAAAGREPITIQPGNFSDSPLSRALYRGCRFEPVWTEEEMVKATADLAAIPGRLIFTYLPHVDLAAHVVGQEAPAYAAALQLVADVWDHIVRRLPPTAVAVGTADHGHLDYDRRSRTEIDSHPGIDFYGDPRALYLRGPEQAVVELAAGLPGRWLPFDQVRPLLGSGRDHPELAARAPTGALLADPGWVLLPGMMDRRLVGYHGGIDPAEVEVPLLIGG